MCRKKKNHIPSLVSFAGHYFAYGLFVGVIYPWYSFYTHTNKKICTAYGEPQKMFNSLNGLVLMKMLPLQLKSIEHWLSYIQLVFLKRFWKWAQLNINRILFSIVV